MKKDVNMNLLKIGIEDVAFCLWDGKKELKTFVKEFLENYPGFKELWIKEELEEALAKRL